MMEHKPIFSRPVSQGQKKEISKLISNFAHLTQEIDVTKGSHNVTTVGSTFEITNACVELIKGLGEFLVACNSVSTRMD